MLWGCKYPGIPQFLSCYKGKGEIYEFKIKKNNEMLEKKVKNIQVRGKLKIIKVDENDSPIE